MRHKLQSLSILLMLFSFTVAADTFPPNWENGAGESIHYSPAPWPVEPVNAADCGTNCGDWKPYTRFQNSINDPRTRDPSNGGTAPQNYVNIASSCVDKDLPSVYYYLHQGTTAADDVIMFRWRVEQIANTYATGNNAGAYSASNPWSSALWTVLFDIDGSGYRSLAAHLNGSSGSPSEPVDMLAGIWSKSQTQSIDYINDPDNVKLLGHNPTAFIDATSGTILNFQNLNTPVASWPNGSAETTWDYGTTRARHVSTRSCNEYFVDYQIPVAMLDASALGGPQITRSTPISMMFCTANSLNDPFQKDCAINKEWAADSERPAPFGDYISFDKEEPYSQPIIAEVTAVAPASCSQDYQLSAKVQDVLALKSGEVDTSVKAVDFYYWLDTDGSGYADEASGEWVHAASATRATDSLNTWTANWNSTSLPKGRYLIGVQAVDDNTLVDDDMIATGVDNRTFSYLAGDALSQVYIDGAWIAGQQSVFPSHAPALSPVATENWFGNPEVTGIQTALVGQAINTCGIAPTLGLTVDKNEIAPAESVIFTITVSNAGNPDAITVSNLSDVLPDGFSYQNSTTSGDFGSVDPVISGQTLSWDFGTPVTILANASTSLNFTATASSIAGTYNDTATATSSFGALASDPVPVVVGSASLALSITPDIYSTSPGGQVTYTLSYSNPSTVAIDNVTLDSVLPGNTSTTGNVSWSLGTLNPGASGTVTLVLDVGAAYTSNSLTLPATFAGTDPASATVSVTAQSTIYVNVPLADVAAFTLDKTASDVQIAPGANVTYTLTYKNYGAVAASNVVITDTLPLGMTYSSSTGGGVEFNGTVTWSLGTVAAGATGSVTVTVIADNPFESANPAVNTAEINWDGGSTIAANTNVGVTGQSCNTYYFRDEMKNVGFDGTDRVATSLPIPLAGDVGTSITIIAPINTSPFLEAVRFYQDPATTVDTEFSGTVDSSIFIDRAPGSGLDLQASLYDYDSVSGVKVLLGTSVTGFGGNTTGELIFSVPVTGTLQKDHRLLWIIEVRSQHASKIVALEIQYNGTVTNLITTGTTFAISAGNFCVTPPANLTINKTVDLTSVPEATSTAVVYNISYANLGSSDATNAVIVDTLPTGISFTSATLNASSIIPSGMNPYTFAVGTVTAGESGVLVINAEVSNTATGLLTNTASFSSDQTSVVTDTTDTLVGTPNSGSGIPVAAELHMSKTYSASLLGASDTVIYTLTVVNAGTANATNVVVTDDFPDQGYFSYTGCTTANGTCSESPTGILDWKVGTLAAGASATLTYQMQTAATGLPNGLTQLDNMASVSDDDYCTGGTPPANCSSDIVSVIASGNSELSLILTANNATVAPGDLIEYTVVVTNNGSSSANDLVVTNPIPLNTGFIEITSGTGSFDTINNRLLFPFASLAAGVSTTYTFSVKVVSPLASGSTTLTDTATVTATNAASANDTVDITATAAPVMSLSLTGPDNVPLPATTLSVDANSTTTLVLVSAALLQPGDYIRVGTSYVQITAIAGDVVTINTPITATSGAAIQLAAKFSIAYQNTGNAAAANVQIAELLPAGWLYVMASPTASSTPVLGQNGAVSWLLGTVNAGSSGTLQFVALPTSSGNFTHTAILSADGIANVTANHTVLVGGLIIDKIVVSDITEPGGQATYTITLTNSLSSAVNGVVVKDLLAAGFTYASSATAPGSFEGGDLSRPIWTVNVPANGSVSITFTVDISADLGAATYQNEVEVTAPAGIGVVSFDALATTAEDVTLLLGTGLISGYVYYGNSPLVGVSVNFYENGTLAYRVYTDNSGRYQRVLEAGSDWRIEILSNTDNDTLLSGLDLTTGVDPESFSIVSGASINRNFVFSLTAPTVVSQITSDQTPVINGTYPSTVTGGVLTVTVNNITYNVGSDLVTSGNNWSLNIPLSDQLNDATYEVAAIITKDGNSRSDVTASELIVDTTAPAIPTVNSQTSTSGTPTLTGTYPSTDAVGGFSVAVNGITYTLGVDAALTVTGDNWMLVIPAANSLPDATYSVLATVIDGAGNSASDVTASELIVDTTAPAIPTVNSQTSTSGTPTLTGTYPSTDAVGGFSVAVNGITYTLGVDAALTVTGDNWMLVIPAANSLPDATYSVLATVIDGAGNSASDVTANELVISLIIIDTDSDGIPDVTDLDDDNDGIPDDLEGEGTVDTDGDGIVDSLDLDSDNDGLLDLVESGVADVLALDTNNDGRIDNSYSFGINGIADIVESFVDSGTVNYNGGFAVDTDDDLIEDFRDIDSDNDGIYDVIESGGTDPDDDGIIGTGTPTVDADGLPPGSGLPPVDADGDGTPDYQQVDSAINVAPIAVDDVAFSAVDGSVDITVLDNDSDPEAATLTVTAVSSASSGTVVINADNSISYIPAAGFSGTDSFTYTITDTGGLTDTATVVITVVSAPTITLPPDVFIDATALFTKVDLGTATAVDYQDKSLPVSLVDGVTFYWSGNNEAIWKATDEIGLSSTAIQVVNVRPLVSFSKDQTVAEGSQVIVKVVLNGPSPIYPVNVTYSVEGTATNPGDHDLISGTAVINSGTQTSIVINITDDGIGEGDETIVLSMTDPSLNQGVQNTHNIIITEDNIAPSVSLDVIQSTSDRLTVAKNDGQVVVTATVTDPDLADTHSYDWSLSNRLLIDHDSDLTTFTFDPENLVEGVYEVWVNVTDNGIPTESNVARVFINVVATLPVLTTADSDNDGLADDIEGFSDSDRDGIPDYLDSVMECNVLPEQGLTYDGYLIEGDPGVCVRVGHYALVGESGGSQITDNDIDIIVDDDLIPDPDADNVGGIFDFIITEVPDNSQSVNIVIPQRVAVPANAVYRKLKNGAWFTFIENTNNRLASIAGEPGFCPPPGSADFQPGLTEGHWCVQVTIEDGGPNDADSQINRMIIDPGGVGVLKSNSETFITTGGGVFNLWGLIIMALVLIGKKLTMLRKIVLALLLAVSTSVSHADTNNQNDVIDSEKAQLSSPGKISIEGDNVQAEVPAKGEEIEAVKFVSKQKQGITLTQEEEVTAQLTKRMNVAPVAEDDIASTAVNTQLHIPVLDNDSDANGDELKVILAKAKHGTVTVNDKSHLQYIPPADFIGEDIIEYYVFDGRGSIPQELEKLGVDIKSLCGDAGCVDSKLEKLSLRLQVNFANNDDSVAEKYFQELEKLVALMQKAPDENIVIEGHTSAVGSARYNQRLSERRAKSIEKELVSRFKVNSARVKAIGYGESQLLNTENTEAAHAQNRRIVAVFDSSLSKKINRKSGVASAKVVLTVFDPNNIPVALDDAAETDQNKDVVVNVLNNDSDIDGDKLTTIKAIAGHGEVKINEESQLIYSPKHNYSGLDKIHYQITDGNGGQADAMVCIFVHKKSPWYVWFDTGATTGTSSTNQLNSELSDAGISATVTGMDDSRSGVQFGAGYHFNDTGWHLEFGYADLGEVELRLTAAAADLNQVYSDIANVHPLSAKGYLMAAQYQWPFSDFDVLAKMGYWSWDASYKTYTTSVIGNDNLSGADLFMGLGAQMSFTKRLSGRLMLQRFKVDSEDTNFVSLGLVYSL